MSKTKLLPMGIENFKRIRADNFYYIDKTGLIKNLLNNIAYMNLFTRPRRFGKTLNMSMLRYFLRLTVTTIHRQTVRSLTDLQFPAKEEIAKNNSQLESFCKAFEENDTAAIEEGFNAYLRKTISIRSAKRCSCRTVWKFRMC